jgi:hypothetical protein
VTDDKAPQRESLEEVTRASNSNLERLIDAVGGLLSASGVLLARLQQILGRAHPAASSNRSDESGSPSDSRDG